MANRYSDAARMRWTQIGTFPPKRRHGTLHKAETQPFAVRIRTIYGGWRFAGYGPSRQGSEALRNSSLSLDCIEFVSRMRCGL